MSKSLAQHRKYAQFAENYAKVATNGDFEPKWNTIMPPMIEHSESPIRAIVSGKELVSK